MTHVDAPDKTRVEAAYRTLHLLPGAPRELIDAAYRALSNDGASSELRDAYEAALAAPVFDVDPYPRRLSPWELLHLSANAPGSLVDAAYKVWLGGAEPLIVRRPAKKPDQPRAEEERRIEQEASVPEAFTSAFEEIAYEEAPAALHIEEERKAAGVLETYLHAFEEFTADPDVSLAIVSSPDEETVEEPGFEESPSMDTAPPIGGPQLSAADGTTVALTDRPLRIGTQPACDVVVRASGRIEARVWRNKGRILVHALGQPGAVLVNGAGVTWGVLNDGDTVAVGPDTFTFRAA